MGKYGELPEGAVFDSVWKQGSGWVVRFRAAWEEEEPMYQLFGNLFYDADGNKYEINQWSSRYGDADEDGHITYFYDEFPLLHFTDDEVWLSPHYSHNWVADNLIVIIIK